MIILGIDPALRNTGYGILEKIGNNFRYIKSGVIKTRSQKLSLSLSEITYDLKIIIEKYQPNAVALEKVFINKNPLSSMSLCYARGAILSVIGEYKINYQEYAPNFIKKSIAGAGKATKEQMIAMINILLPGNNFKNHDEVDAIACAYTSMLQNQSY